MKLERVSVMMMSEGFLSPKSDIIFKLLFGDERSIEFLTDFLKSVLRLSDEDYDEVTIVDPHLLREYDGDKLGILDVKIKTKTKKVVDIEIQVRPSIHLKSRIMFYTSKMVAEQIGSGDNYLDIKHVISILITDHELIARSPKYQHRFVLYDAENGIEFSDIIEVNTLELTKIPKNEDGTNLWNWLKFLSSERKEDLDMIAEKNPQIKKAVVRLMELSNDERTRLLYESRQKMEWDIQSRERGAIITVARNLLNKKISVEDIVDATGLTREEVEGLSGAV